MESHGAHRPCAALIVRGLHKRYRAGVAGCLAEVAVLRGVDLEVSAGEVVAVVGAEGAGLRTLLLCAAGLLRPDAGSVTWGAAGVRTGRLAPGVALVLRDPALVVAEPAAAWHARALDGPSPGLLLVGPDCAHTTGELCDVLATTARRRVAVVVARRRLDAVCARANRVLELRDGRCLPLAVARGSAERSNEPIIRQG